MSYARLNQVFNNNNAQDDVDMLELHPVLVAENAQPPSLEMRLREAIEAMSYYYGCEKNNKSNHRYGFILTAICAPFIPVSLLAAFFINTIYQHEKLLPYWRDQIIRVGGEWFEKAEELKLLKSTLRALPIEAFYRAYKYVFDIDIKCTFRGVDESWSLMGKVNEIVYTLNSYCNYAFKVYPNKTYPWGDCYAGFNTACETINNSTTFVKFLNISEKIQVIETWQNHNFHIGKKIKLLEGYINKCVNNETMNIPLLISVIIAVLIIIPLIGIYGANNCSLNRKLKMLSTTDMLMNYKSCEQIDNIKNTARHFNIDLAASPKVIKEQLEVEAQNLRERIEKRVAFLGGKLRSEARSYQFFHSPGSKDTTKLILKYAGL